MPESLTTEAVLLSLLAQKNQSDQHVIDQVIRSQSENTQVLTAALVSVTERLIEALGDKEAHTTKIVEQQGGIIERLTIASVHGVPNPPSPSPHFEYRDSVTNTPRKFNVNPFGEVTTDGGT